MNCPHGASLFLHPPFPPRRAWSIDHLFFIHPPRLPRNPAMMTDKKFEARFYAPPEVVSNGLQVLILLGWAQLRPHLPSTSRTP